MYAIQWHREGVEERYSNILEFDDEAKEAEAALEKAAKASLISRFDLFPIASLAGLDEMLIDLLVPDPEDGD